jgi:hypothetical protein
LFLTGQTMSIEDTGQDECPCCKKPCEIAAVKFSVMLPPSMLFVCNSCGLVQAEATAKSPPFSQRATIVLGLMMVVLYMVLAFGQPSYLSKLVTAVEQTLGLGGTQAHRPELGGGEGQPISR